MSRLTRQRPRTRARPSDTARPGDGTLSSGLRRSRIAGHTAGGCTRHPRLVPPLGNHTGTLPFRSAPSDRLRGLPRGAPPCSAHGNRIWNDPPARAQSRPASRSTSLPGGKERVRRVRAFAGSRRAVASGDGRFSTFNARKRGVPSLEALRRGLAKRGAGSPGAASVAEGSPLWSSHRRRFCCHFDATRPCTGLS